MEEGPGTCGQSVIRPSQKLKSECVLLKIVMGINKRNDPFSKKLIPAQHSGCVLSALKQMHLHLGQFHLIVRGWEGDRAPPE